MKATKTVSIQERDDCPSCGSSWFGATIPEKDRHLFGTDKPHFSRLIGCETPDYDGVSYWLCPDCGAEWDGWTNRRRAARYEARVKQEGAK